MTDQRLCYAHASFAGLIGIGREDVTPPVGIYARNWGAAAHDVAEGIHRPLRVTALAFRRSTAELPLVLVALDLGWWRTPQDEWFVRGGLLDALGLEPARVMVSLSHTHAGPSICREEADKPGGELIAPYLELVRDRAVAAARRALAACEPSTLAWARGTCDLAQNRDLPQGRRVVCGFNPFGRADDTLLVGRVTAREGTLLASVVNYACHPTTLAWENRLISPDFVGALREVVERDTGGAPCLFLQGASGELAPREQYTADTAIADAHGRKVGFSVLAVLEGMLPDRAELEYERVVESGAPLAIWRRTLQSPSETIRATRLPIEVPLKDLASLDEIEAQLRACDDPALSERLRRKLWVRRAVGDGRTTVLPLWLWQLGDALLLGQPAEAYSHLQTALRHRFQDRLLVVMNLTNGCNFGYLPPAELYDQDVYQVWQTPFARGSLERVLEACQEAVELHAG